MMVFLLKKRVRDISVFEEYFPNNQGIHDITYYLIQRRHYVFRENNGSSSSRFRIT